MLGVVILVDSVSYASVKLSYQNRVEEYRAHPKAFMYPNVEKDTQNAPKTTIQARVPPSGNSVGFSSSSRSGPAELLGVARSTDTCEVDIPRVDREWGVIISSEQDMESRFLLQFS